MFWPFLFPVGGEKVFQIRLPFFWRSKFQGKLRVKIFEEDIYFYALPNNFRLPQRP